MKKTCENWPGVDHETISLAITKEDDFFIAGCPELNVTSQGGTLEEAEENIRRL